MLQALTLEGFKSFRTPVRIELAPLTVIFGPNASGKSNLIDALLVLSRLATQPTLAEAVSPPVRGNPLELFSLPRGGLAALLDGPPPRLHLEAELTVPSVTRTLRYRCTIAGQPRSGVLTVDDEHLVRLKKNGEISGRPVIERMNGTLRVRRKDKPGRPEQEPVGLGSTVLSNRRFSGDSYTPIEAVRTALANVRTYYLDPRVTMREGRAPREVDDVGTLGETLAPFLYRLREEHRRRFEEVVRLLRTLIPGLEELRVELDTQRGLVDVQIVQNATPFSIRVVSEGTLRVLALACIAVNPWPNTLIAYEEPENGVHPRRLEHIARLLESIALEATERRQVIVTTHSPSLCAHMARVARRRPEEVALYSASNREGQSRFTPLNAQLSLLVDEEIRQRLSPPDEATVFEALWQRGLLGD